jgi:NADH dehydrogenase [ubiquinone] 1 alpha subcomplex assembly factor 7
MDNMHQGGSRGSDVSVDRRDTPLAIKLKELIRREGPIALARYVEICRYDPQHGYYRTRAVIGSKGDFITAPEISQVFGELVGLWCAVVWQSIGSPKPFYLVELGPGRGTMLSDALRAARVVSEFLGSVLVQLIEVSATMKAIQRAALLSAPAPVVWHDRLSHVPDGAAIVVANEFLDTLPVAQWVKTASGWRERGVGLDEQGGLSFVALEKLATGAAFARWSNLRVGDIVERQSFGPLLSELERRARRASQAALFIDYGHTQTRPSDTLEAVRNHRHEHPLSSPGEADLTHQVDFESLASEARSIGLSVDGPITQAELLGALGIAERASRLIEANPAMANAIEMSVQRLMAPAGMGTRFKALAVRSRELQPLPGFAALDIFLPGT